MGLFFDQILDAASAAIKAALAMFVTWLQDYLKSSPDPSGDVDALGTSWGYADRIAFGTVVVAIVFFLWRRNKYQSVGHALFNLCVINIAGWFWYDILTAIAKAEAGLSEMAKFHPGDNPLLTPASMPVIDNPLIAILAMGDVGVGVYHTVNLYGFLDALGLQSQRFFLVAMAFSALGPRSKRAFQVVISVFILTHVFAHPVGVFSLETGEWLQAVMPYGKTMLGVIVSLRMSLYLIFVLVTVVAVLAYYAPSAIEGMVQGKSDVKGDVKAKLEDGQRVLADTIEREDRNIFYMPEIQRPNTLEGTVNVQTDTPSATRTDASDGTPAQPADASATATSRASVDQVNVTVNVHETATDDVHAVHTRREEDAHDN